MKLIYTKTHILSKLHDELLAAGIPLDNGGASPVQGIGDEIYIYVADSIPQATIDQITAIVNAHDPTPPPSLLQSLNITADKAQITADGIDTATIIITLEPAGTGVTAVDVLVDGPPVTEIDIIDNVAIFEFTATDAGKYMVEVISGNIRNHIFVKAV